MSCALLATLREVFENLPNQTEKAKIPLYYLILFRVRGCCYCRISSVNVCFYYDCLFLAFLYSLAICVRLVQFYSSLFQQALQITFRPFICSHLQF